MGSELSSWVFRGSKIFSPRSKVLVGISWVQNIFSGVFHVSIFFLVGNLWVKIFSCRNFVGPKYFLVGIT